MTNSTLYLFLSLFSLICITDAKYYYDFSAFDEKSITQDEEGKCIKAQCLDSTEETSCYSLDKKSSKLIMNSLICNRPKEFCDINNRFSGVC